MAVPLQNGGNKHKPRNGLSVFQITLLYMGDTSANFVIQPVVFLRE